MSFPPQTCILLCFLISISRLNCAATQNTGTFQKPSTNSDARFSALQDDLLKVQNQILVLNTAVAAGDTSQDLKARISTLESEFEKLKNQISDQRRESDASNGKYDIAINMLTNYYNTLEGQLKTLLESIEKRRQDEAARQLPGDIAEAIRSHRFPAAESLILQMGDNDKIHKIVHEVYANAQGNTDVLLDFAKALTRINLSFYVLSALRYEMRANGHRDPYKMMALVRAFENEVINQSGALGNVKSTAQAMVDGTINDIKAAATDALKTAMYSDTYQKNVQVETLANAIDDFRSEVSDEVMQRIVSETYPTVTAGKIADNIYSNKYIPQIAAGLVGLFRKLESVNDLNNNAVLTIADYLSRLQRMTNWKHLSDEKKESVDKVFENMPTCARNLFLAESVCFLNRGTNEYLYAASSPYNWNRDRRSIFTWGNGDAVIQSPWFVQKDDDTFYFKNKAYPNEYMYAAGVRTYDKDRRYVFTWTSGGIVEHKGGWHVTLDGDYCLLKNHHYNEYLFASDKWHSDKRRYVFTWIPQSGLLPEFQWQIRPCK